MPDETYKRLRHEPESWTVEIHTVEVYVGTDGDHQDEFLRGNRPRDLLRNSIVTPSLLASILNVKYVNSSALHRIEQEFQRNGVNISRQTMSNWIVKCSQMYFTPFVERMKQELLSLHVTQSDETPTQVIADSDHPNSKCYMWVHRSGEFYTRRPIVVYEYQKGRDHQKPLDFYKDYKGVLVTDSLQLGRLANLCVYVCRADYTPKASFGMINGLKAENKLPNMCLVLNGVDLSKKKHSFYYGVGKYGKYGKYGNYGSYGSLVPNQLRYQTALHPGTDLKNWPLWQCQRQQY